MSVSGRAPGPHVASGVAAGNDDPVADSTPERVSPAKPAARAAVTTPRRRRAAVRARRLRSMSTSTSGCREEYGRARPDSRSGPELVEPGHGVVETAHQVGHHVG